MKTIKGNWLGIFVFFSILLGSCFNPPEFSIFPTIERPETGPFLEFKPGLNTDSLIVFFDFKDGDGDLGLGPTQIDDPYHPVFYYLANAAGDTIPLATATDVDTGKPLVIVPNGAVGKLFTYHTRDQAQYQDFPPYVCPFSRTEYQYDSVFVEEADKHIFEQLPAHMLKRKIERGDNDIYVLRDTFYIKQNPNHFNVEVQFWTKNGDGSFSIYDWKKELCVPQDFSQRFPVLTNAQNPLAGTLKYAMESIGFKAIFSGRTLKLKVRIRDRALHTSRWLETNDLIIQ
jgi:hypothetical protein